MLYTGTPPAAAARHGHTTPAATTAGQLTSSTTHLHTPRPIAASTDHHVPTTTTSPGLVAADGRRACCPVPCTTTTNNTSTFLQHGPAAVVVVGGSSSRCLPSSANPSIKTEHCTDEDEAESVGINPGLEWLKVSVPAEDLDLLEADDSKVASSSSLMDTGSEFSDRVDDFVLTSPLPDSAIMKQNVAASYLETLDNFTRAVSTADMSWACSHNPGLQTPSLPAAAATETFVSFPEALVEEVNNTGNISCSSADLNSLLFEGIAHEMKHDPIPAVDIMQYSDSLHFAVGKQHLCSDDSVNNFNSMASSSSSHIKPVALTFASAMVDQVTLPNLHDTSTDLNLSSLPNFLGLENASADVSTSSHFIEGNSVNILEENNLSLEGQAVTGAGSMQENTLHSIDSSQLHNQNITITTISISSDEKNATRILVDSHQGQQQMYVINTANIHKSHSGSLPQGNMFVINASDLSTASSAGTFSISSLDSRVENMAVASQQVVAARPALNTSTIPGFVLVPVVDSSANVVQAVPIQISDGDPNTQRPKKMLMCVAPGCRKTFKKASKLKVHQMLHTGERPFKCSLLGCEWAFTTSNKLKRHMESHEGRKDYVCDKPGCGHRFTTVYNLKNHRKLHDRPCTETCTEQGCLQKFATKRQLDLHLRNVHACEDRTFKCPEAGCDKTFFSSGCMGSHMKVHQQNQGELRCKLPGCGKQFTKMCRLRQHQRLHSGDKPFICDYQGCTWAFATASKLKRHQTKHTGLRKWVCEVCKKQFHRSEHLKGHLITHSGDRPFICPVEGCGNTFTAKSSLYVHLKKHDESGKTIVYHCPMEKCQKHYANKASLRQHILVKHCSLPHKGATEGSQGMVSWLSLLGSGDTGADITLGQDSFTEGLGQTSVTPGQDSMLPTDFLMAGMTDQALLNSSSETLPDQSCPGLMSQFVMSTGAGVTLSSPDTAPATTAAEVPAHPQQPQQHLQQPQPQQHMFIDDSVDPRLLEAGEILQQQERMSFEAVERGKKSQIMLDNVLGSARTDPRSNDIISHRALKRWQKQKEAEAASLRVKLNAPTAPGTSCSLAMDAEGDYKNIVSNNVSLAGHHMIQTVQVHGPVAGEMPDMELHAEGLSDSSPSPGSGADSFMTELFIRDPETGITYRQTQLLQDDPPNPEMMEDLEGVTSCHGMALEPSLDAQFVEDSLSFHNLE